MRAIILLFSILFASVAGLSGQSLVWERTLVEPLFAAGDQRAEAVYPFTNRGSRPVAITAVESDCGCTTAKLEKKVYLPGESGEITTVFVPGNRTGLQERIVRVSTDEGEEAVRLVLRVRVPETVQVSPRIVFWRLGEAAEPKGVIVRVNPESGLVLKEISSGNPDVRVRWEPAEEAGAYRVMLQPAGTREPLKAVIAVSTAFPDDPSREAPTLMVYAHVFD